MNFIETFFPEHFTRNDKRGVTIGLMVSAVFLVGLIYSKPPNNNAALLPIAKIDTFQNKVRHKNFSSVSFYEIFKNEQLQNNDEIFTGEDSSAEVSFFKSKIKIQIPSNSLVKIEETENGQSIEIKEGVVDIVMKKNQQINIITDGKNQVIKSTNDNAKVKAYYASGGLKVFTKDEGISVKNGTTEKPIIQNSEVSFKKGELIKESSFKLLSPMPGEKIDSVEGIKINTSEKANYSVSISKNPDFSENVSDVKFDGNNFDWEASLDEGDYFIKVGNGKDEHIVPIKLASKYKIEEQHPGNGEEVITQPSEGVVLKWKPLPVKSYKVLVKDGSGSEKSFVTTTNEIKIPDIKGSNLQWSVMPELKPNKFSQVKKTVSSNIKYQGKMELLSPATNSKHKLKNEPINLEWKAKANEQVLVRVFDAKTSEEVLQKIVAKNNFNFLPKKVGNYKVELVSVDYPTLEKAVVPISVTGVMAKWPKEIPTEVKSTESKEQFEIKYNSNTEELKKPTLDVTFKPKNGGVVKSKTSLVGLTKYEFNGFGKYCFKVGSEEELPLYEDSSEHCVNFVQVPVFPVLEKTKDQIMSYKKHNGVDSYRITCPLIPKAVKYNFEIYRNQKDKTFVYSSESTKPEIYWASNRSGIYYMKFKVTDIKNRSSEFSPFSKLIFPISPLSEW